MICNLGVASTKSAAAEKRENQQAKKCLSSINMDTINGIKEEEIEVSNKITRFCQNNNRNKAQSEAMRFATKLQKSKYIYIVKRCERIKNNTDKDIRKIINRYFVSKLRFKHICDHV